MWKPKDALQAIPGGKEIIEKYAETSNKGSSAGRDNRIDAVVPNMAKIIRLTFHDCVKEKESGAGCNGCLNFEGMGNIYAAQVCNIGKRGTKCSEVEGATRPLKGPFKTDNNNLQWVARVLEEVYKNATFGPDKLRDFDVSLFESGKSRADLWAFAGLVAVQRGTEQNNYFCDPTKSKPAPCWNQINEESPSCFIDLPAPKFRHGRSDCKPSCSGEDNFDFCTTHEEVHPNPHGNGKETIGFFKDQFDLDPRESAALMGVHTLGHPQEFNSMFRHYSWTGQRQKTQFNNQYYQFIVNNKTYRQMNPLKLPIMKGTKAKNCGLKVSTYIGDEFGNPFDVRYRVRSEWRTEAGGPWDWSLEGMGCSKVICDKIDANDYNINSCCHWLDQCVSDPKFKRPTHNYVCEGEEGCTGRDVFTGISMISPDMGLYYDFGTDENGRPAGCTGMDEKLWLDNGNKNRMSGEVACKMNKTPTPDGKTISEVMELYAEDQTTWINDFVSVYDKMLENGVPKESLNDVPTAWFNAYCNDYKQICL